MILQNALPALALVVATAAAPPAAVADELFVNGAAEVGLKWFLSRWSW